MQIGGFITFHIEYDLNFAYCPFKNYNQQKVKLDFILDTFCLLLVGKFPLCTVTIKYIS